MTGLFATLVAAAEGRAAAVEPRPLARFEALAPDIAQMSAGDAPGLAADAPPPLQAGIPAPTHAVPREARRLGPRQEPSDRPVQTVRLLPDTATPMPPPDRRRPAGPRPTVVSPSQHETDAPRRVPSNDQPRFETGTEQPPTRLLPLMSAPTTPADAGAPSSIAGVSVRRSAGTPAATAAGHDSFSLTIGRIEVRQTPSPAPRATPQATVRAVSLPRAAVRQSLDDYRSGRRR